MIQAIITDLDGTVLPRGGNISPTDAEAFHRAGTHGVVRIIATGRNLYSVRNILPDDFPADYLVFSSGAGIMRWQDKKMMTTWQLSEVETREIASQLWDYNINFTIQKEVPENHCFYYTDMYPLHEDYKRRIENNKDFGTLIECTGDIRGGATQLILILDEIHIRLLEQLRGQLSRFSVIRSTSPIDNKAVWIEIFGQGVNKGNACEYLLNRLQVPYSACAGLGNDYNDIDFLERCGQAFMVENATYRQKSAFKTVAADAKNGFAEFISKVVPEEK